MGIKIEGRLPERAIPRFLTHRYYNPIVRFHKVRPNEHVWLSDEALLDATDPSFRDALIYDTERLAAPTVKK